VRLYNELRNVFNHVERLAPRMIAVGPHVALPLSIAGSAPDVAVRPSPAAFPPQAQLLWLLWQPCGLLYRLLRLRATVVGFMQRGALASGDAAAVLEVARCWTRIGAAWHAASTGLRPLETALWADAFPHDSAAAAPKGLAPPPLMLAAHTLTLSDGAYACALEASDSLGGDDAVRVLLSASCDSYASTTGSTTNRAGVVWSEAAQSLCDSAIGRVRALLLLAAIQQPSVSPESQTAAGATAALQTRSHGPRGQLIVPLLCRAASLLQDLPPDMLPAFVDTAAAAAQVLCGDPAASGGGGDQPQGPAAAAAAASGTRQDVPSGCNWGEASACLRMAIDAALAAPPHYWDEGAGRTGAAAAGGGGAADPRGISAVAPPQSVFSLLFPAAALLPPPPHGSQLSCGGGGGGGLLLTSLDPPGPNAAAAVSDGSGHRTVMGAHAALVGRLRLTLAYTLLQQQQEQARQTLRQSDAPEAMSDSGNCATSTWSLPITALIVGSGLAAEPLALHTLVSVAVLTGDTDAALAHATTLIEVCAARVSAAGHCASFDAGTALLQPQQLPQQQGHHLHHQLFGLVRLTCRCVASALRWSVQGVNLYSKACKAFADSRCVGSLRVDMISYMLAGEAVGGGGTVQHCLPMHLCAHIVLLNDALYRPTRSSNICQKPAA
jgi:hypothetical protein